MFNGLRVVAQLTSPSMPTGVRWSLRGFVRLTGCKQTAYIMSLLISSGGLAIAQTTAKADLPHAISQFDNLNFVVARREFESLANDGSTIQPLLYLGRIALLLHQPDS